MSSREVSRWLAYDNVYGLPDPWQQTAMICRSMSGGKLSDYMPRRVRRKGRDRKISPEQQKMMMNAVFGIRSKM